MFPPIKGLNSLLQENVPSYGKTSWSPIKFPPKKRLNSLLQGDALSLGQIALGQIRQTQTIFHCVKHIVRVCTISNKEII